MRRETDFKRDSPELYSPPADHFTVVDVPRLSFLVVDGAGDPNTSLEYSEAVEALFAASYAVRSASEHEDRIYSVGPLEGFWTPDPASELLDKSTWSWTMAIRQPEWMNRERIEQIVAETTAKKHLPGLARVRWEEIAEGLSVQIMHVGSYAEETPTIERLHREFLPEHGFVEAGRHHEIYLGDPRRVEPAKLKTVLRQPVRPR